jgi:hypothetical protein
MTQKFHDVEQLEPRELLQQVAYIRPVFVEGSQAYSVHAADGRPLFVMDTMDSALVVVRHNDLEPVTVH